MSLPSGSRLQNGEYERIQKAVSELERQQKEGLKLGEHHVPREISVQVVLHAYNEYPKQLYKGRGTKDSIRVSDEKSEKEARANGYGEHVPEGV